MTEQQAIERIHSVYPSGKKEGLTNMRALLARVGNPHLGLKMVHVAGTNGKGSCCAMLERVLREAGYKTGLYSSPYIERYNERIRIGFAPILSGDFRALWSLGTGWGVFSKTEAQTKIELAGGYLPIETLTLGNAGTVKAVIIDGEAVDFAQNGDEISFARKEIRANITVEWVNT